MKLKVSSVLAGSSPERQGYLLKKGSRNHASYQRRWFLLWGNLLFYYEKQGDPQPLGIIVLERCSVSLRHSRQEYAFSLYSLSRVYKMAAECQKDLELWVKALFSANVGYTKALLDEVRGQYQILNAGDNGPNTKCPQENTWKADFGALHHWLGEEILPLRAKNITES
ncbi:sesquipedalian-1 [Xenopus laevis]|uniref:PH domain-containing protein n=2 Tax=Xenopus laevis TaxID=8355 RepID=A0A974H4G4_XENLA|nr:sesquipedalian-1 [Xenopus laevis]OCT64548.1 hypothetical protein XELAEV_18045647mg [Xenopus laevis]